jgi:hypothetical protein
LSVPRRVTLVFAALVALGAVVVIAVPRSEPVDDPTPRTMPKGSIVGRAVRGRLPRDKVVRARVGELVDLTVTSRVPDSAAIDAFGLVDATDRDAPARFSFLADHPGSFDVTLQLGKRRTVGRVVVTEP